MARPAARSPSRPGQWVQIGGIAVTPSDPAHLWIALNRLQDLGGGQQGWSGDVLESTDGGTTWTELGGAVLPEVTIFALGLDGQRNLYAGNGRRRLQAWLATASGHVSASLGTVCPSRMTARWPPALLGQILSVTS